MHMRWLVGLNLKHLTYTLPQVSVSLIPPPLQLRSLSPFVPHSSQRGILQRMGVSPLCSSVAKNKKQKKNYGSGHQLTRQAPSSHPALAQPARGRCDTRVEGCSKLGHLKAIVSDCFVPFWGPWEGVVSMAAQETQGFSNSAANLVHGVVLFLKHPQVPRRLSPGRISCFCLAE